VDGVTDGIYVRRRLRFLRPLGPLTVAALSVACVQGLGIKARPFQAPFEHKSLSLCFVAGDPFPALQSVTGICVLRGPYTVSQTSYRSANSGTAPAPAHTILPQLQASPCTCLWQSARLLSGGSGRTADLQEAVAHRM
jgi:hypothetical protein